MSPRVSGEVRTLRAGALHSRGSRGWGGRHSRGVARVLGLCPRDAGSDSKLSLGQHIDAPYRQIARQCRLVRERVAELPQPATTAICAFAALRLMAEHASWPQEEQNTFVLAWGPVLQLILQALIAPSAQIDKALQERLNEYYAGPYCHELGEEAREGADEDAASASIYALESYCRLFYWWTRLPLGPTAPWPI